VKLNELHLHEETLQQAVRRLLKPAGTIEKVMGRDAKAVATLLDAKSSDPALTLRGDSPASERMLQSLVGTRPHEESDSDDHGRIYSVRMPGGARLVIVGEKGRAFAITSEHQRDQLVESKLGKYHNDFKAEARREFKLQLINANPEDWADDNGPVYHGRHKRPGDVGAIQMDIEHVLGQEYDVTSDYGGEHDEYDIITIHTPDAETEETISDKLQDVDFDHAGYEGYDFIRPRKPFKRPY